MEPIPLKKNRPTKTTGDGRRPAGDRRCSPPPVPGMPRGEPSVEDAVVNPVVSGNTPVLGPLAFMVSAGPDVEALVKACAVDGMNRRSLYMSRLYTEDRDGGVTIAGPVLGAPYAGMMIETLAAWGVREVVYVGWCGSLDAGLDIGDILIPTGAFVDEGTSRHYDGRWESDIGGDTPRDAPVLSNPSPRITDSIRRVFKIRDVPCVQGPVWTTDGVYRETRRKVDYYRTRGALAVEMETSALFSIGTCRGVEVGAVLVVSDDLSSQTWRPGFKNERFKTGRKMALGALKELVAGGKAAGRG